MIHQLRHSQLLNLTMAVRNHSLAIEGGVVVLFIDHVHGNVHPIIPGNYRCRDSGGLLEIESHL